MRCYHIEKGKVRKGLPPGTLPVDDALEGKRVERAEAELTGPDGLALGMGDLQRLPLHRFSAVCRLRLVASAKKTEDRALVAYSPKDLFPDRDGGDESEVIHRSPDLFVAMVRKGRTRMFFADGKSVLVFDDRGVCSAGADAAPLVKEPEGFVVRVS